MTRASKLGFFYLHLHSIVRFIEFGKRVIDNVQRPFFYALKKNIFTFFNKMFASIKLYTTFVG